MARGTPRMTPPPPAPPVLSTAPARPHGSTAARGARRRPVVVAAAAASLVTLLTGCGTGPAAPGRPSGSARPTTDTATATSGPSPQAESTPAATGATARPTGTPGTPRGGLPDPATVDGTRPEAVARWVLTAWYSYDTRLDAGPSDTARRALPWLTPSLAAVVRQAAPIAAPPADWTRWAQAHAYATVHLTPSGDDHPPDTALQVYRAWVVDITLHPAPPTDRTQHLVAFVHLSRPDLHTPWRVEEVMTR